MGACRLIDCVHGRDRDAALLTVPKEPLLFEPPQFLLNQRFERVVVARAAGHIDEEFVLAPLGVAEHVEELVPFTFGAHDDIDVTIRDRLLADIRDRR